MPEPTPSPSHWKDIVVIYLIMCAIGGIEHQYTKRRADAALAALPASVPRLQSQHIDVPALMTPAEREEFRAKIAPSHRPSQTRADLERLNTIMQHAIDRLPPATQALIRRPEK